MSETNRWRGEIWEIYSDSFDARLINFEDEGDIRQAKIMLSTLSESDRKAIVSGMRFECTTVIPALPGQPIIKNLVLKSVPPLILNREGTEEYRQI